MDERERAIEDYRRACANYQEPIEPPRPAALDAAIETLYDTFAVYSQWNKESFKLKDNSPLLSKHLRDLKGSALFEFIGCAILTMGDLNDYRHFLPRIIDLCSQSKDAESIHDSTLVFSRLAYAWNQLLPTERKAIQSYLDVWFESTLCEFPSRTRMCQVIESIACINYNMVSFLTQWSRNLSEAALQHFIEDFELLSLHSMHSSNESLQQIQRWLYCMDTHEWLVRAYLQYSDKEWSDDLLSVIELIELRNAHKACN